MYKVVKIVLIFLAGPGQFCLVGPDWSWAVLAGSRASQKVYLWLCKKEMRSWKSTS
jgi:hypothetical protein